ncbi:hypothetical protein [Calothrix rhizosoleniae]|nr:hypothetical protein [Calothrix rhizosoleniae]
MAAPLQSALMYQFIAVGHKSRFTLRPEDFQSLGFSPCFGSVSPIK